ncbi:MAG TPA: patatin-like phospholipase family protein [Alphaproteobacteria bacterium]|nr:patatin-like phospholipase family protein [Alphaproteobacteria bacterium]
MADGDAQPEPADLPALLAEVPLFAGLAAAALEALAAEMEWFALPGGAALFEAGEPSDALYILVSGSLAVLRDGAVVGRIGGGEAVGEMGLLEGRPRSATVTALRDCELLRLPGAAFEAVVLRHPQALLDLTRSLARRLGRANAAPQPAPVRSLAILPLLPGLDAAAFARDLGAALARCGLSAHCLGAEAAGWTSGRFHRLEAEHGALVFVGEAAATPWSRLCLRQADRVLLLAVPGAAPPSPLLPLLRELPRGLLDLVVLHPGAAAEPVAPWIADMPVELRHNLRAGRPADLARFARLAAGRAVGVVLAGGGARGFAHLGVLRALEEAGVAVDLAGGTSMGAIVAACVAMDWSLEEASGRLRDCFVASNPLSDYTLPLVALTRGLKVERLLRAHFGEGGIEELWRPFYCVSANLSAGRAELHRRGALWRALRASIAIPGVLPPVAAFGEVLVDGGVVANFPVEAMAALHRGPVVGIDVAADRALTAQPEALTRGPLWWLMNRRRHGTPGIVSVLMRAGMVGSTVQDRARRGQVDLLFQPKLDTIDLRDWRAFDRAVEAGYIHAAELLAARGRPLFAQP